MGFVEYVQRKSQCITLLGWCVRRNNRIITKCVYRKYSTYIGKLEQASDNFQKKLWDSYANQKGDEWADSVSARAGYSEHQTGYTLDIVTYNANMSNFETTDEFKWLQANAYKYGFILRYPKDKEDITGYSYESWHYRYVGEETAKKIKKLDITFDEYYAYFIKQVIPILFLYSYNIVVII